MFEEGTAKSMEDFAEDIVDKLSRLFTGDTGDDRSSSPEHGVAALLRDNGSQLAGVSMAWSTQENVSVDGVVNKFKC